MKLFGHRIKMPSIGFVRIESVWFILFSSITVLAIVAFVYICVFNFRQSCLMATKGLYSIISIYLMNELIVCMRSINFKYQHSLIFWFDWNSFELATVMEAIFKWFRFGWLVGWLCWWDYLCLSIFPFATVTLSGFSIPFKHVAVFSLIAVVEFSIGNFQFPQQR